MRILYLVQRFLPEIGGAELHVYNLGKRLSRSHEVKVFTFGNRVTQYWIDDMEVKCFPSIEINWKTGFTNLSFSMISSIIREGSDSDIIHAHAYGFAQTEYASRLGRLLRRPVVITPHYDRSLSASTSTRIKRFLYDNFVGIPGLRFADHIIAVTRSEEIFLRYHFRIAGEKISVIPNGVDIQRFLNLPDPAPLKEKFGLDGFPLVLFVGRIEEKKGIQFLLRACQPLIDAMLGFKLLVVGEDWGYMNVLKELGSDLGIASNVIFTGRLNEEDLLRAYNLCDLVVLPSLGEATGLTLLEAMASRKPVVASRLGPIEEIVDDYENGILVNPGDVNELRRALRTLVEDDGLRKPMGERGFLKAKSYDWDLIVHKVEKLYEDLVLKRE